MFESVATNAQLGDTSLNLGDTLKIFVKSFSKENKQHFFEIDNKLLTRNGKTDSYISKENKEWIKTNKTSFLGALPILQMSLNDKILAKLDLAATQKIDYKGIAKDIKNELQIQDDTTNKRAFIAYLEDTIFRSYEGVRELFNNDTDAKKFTKEVVTKKVKEYLEYKKSGDGPAIPSKARLQEKFPATFKAISDRPISKRSKRIIEYELEDNNMHYYYPKVRNEITKFVVKSALEKIAEEMIRSSNAPIKTPALTTTALTKTDKITAGNKILDAHLKAHKAENKPPLFKGIGISFKKMDDGFLIDGVFSPDIQRFKQGTKMMSKENQTELLGRKITHIKQKGVEHNFEALKNLPMDELREFFSNDEEITLTISYKDKTTGNDTTTKIICEKGNRGYFVTNAASNTKKELDDVVCEKYDPEKHGIDVIDGFGDQAESLLGLSHETQGILNIPSENIPHTRLRSGATATQLRGRSTVNSRG